MRALAITLLLCATACAGRDTRPALTFEQLVHDRVSAVPGALVGVYLKDLGDSTEWTINADSVFHAASTMKVPVMIEYFRQLQEGRFVAEETIQLDNRFASIVDGSVYSLNAEEDSDSAMYARIGSEVPVRELVERMITRSSNLATNAVIELIDARRAQATARALGAMTISAARRGHRLSARGACAIHLGRADAEHRRPSAGTGSDSGRGAVRVGAAGARPQLTRRVQDAVPRAAARRSGQCYLR
jgi:beta-lactamase class A